MLGIVLILAEVTVGGILIRSKLEPWLTRLSHKRCLLVISDKAIKRRSM